MTDPVLPQVSIGPISIDELTTGTLDGTGVFDVQMRAVKAHLDAEYKAQRIRGADYANVYISSLTAVLGQASAYVTTRMRLGLELEQIKAQTALVEAQREQVQAETINADVQRLLIMAQTDQVLEDVKKGPHEIAILEGQKAHQSVQTSLVGKQLEQLNEEIKKLPVEVELLQNQVTQATAQHALTRAQTETVTLENLRAPKQLELLAAQVTQATTQTQVTTEQIAQIKADVAKSVQDTANAVLQGTVIDAQAKQTQAQTALVNANLSKVPVEIQAIEAQNMLNEKQGMKLEKDIQLQVIRLDIEGQQLEIAREELKLKAQQLLLIKAQVEGQQFQTELVAQKVITEKAQTNGTVIGEGSVIGVQNKLYTAQIEGFRRDAEQKIAKMMIDTWSVRRSNDDAVQANTTNRLDDSHVGAAVQAALAGINVTGV